jgi:hypothetical protein
MQGVMGRWQYSTGRGGSGASVQPTGLMHGWLCFAGARAIGASHGRRRAERRVKSKRRGSVASRCCCNIDEAAGGMHRASGTNLRLVKERPARLAELYIGEATAEQARDEWVDAAASRPAVITRRLDERSAAAMAERNERVRAAAAPLPSRLGIYTHPGDAWPARRDGCSEALIARVLRIGRST